MIVSFRHKGLKAFYETGSVRGIQPAHRQKLALVLLALEDAESVLDLALPSLRAHPLRGSRVGFWSLWVNGNWRVTFRFAGNDVELLDYEDYH